MKPIDSMENASQCICRGCPVYVKCSREKDELLYCARGLSVCQPDGSKMCICGSCPVYAQNNLTGGYFCLKE